MTARKPPPPPQEFTISAGMVKWIVGFVGAVLGAVVAWFVVWDRIDTHWRLETVAAAKEKEQIVREKAVDDQIHLVAKKAEVGRAWVVFSVTDTKAYTAAQFARICKALKLPTDECDRQKEDAQRFQRDADNAKQSAAATGKE